ncbi:hypothetical protein DAPPUDRAFT_100270 [Daphnia pulex]|uniref:Peptidase S1 domain-containing protein n=1 Tax=Daphnia pulex TaxID=6669 RepID=E9G9Y1_DAPPU|nr:hypothetical protein DAPPUDRAFT_100270 [Daphnia pulex]|eukprot:EFX83646.1 hypothetical protein DAPPUDRAFT_100270 [Daphnia pulex]
MSAKFLEDLQGSLALVLLTAAGFTFVSDDSQTFDNRQSYDRALLRWFAEWPTTWRQAKSSVERETAPNEFPWQAILLVVKSNETNFCRGSLIADRWILTTASCLEVSSGQKLKVLNVYLGAHNISATSEVNRKEYWGNETFIHPNWNPTTEAGDIALDNLSTVVEYTKCIRLSVHASGICLPKPSEPDHVNQNVTVTGVDVQLVASCKANRRVYNGYKVYIHPEWQARDIALIKLYNIVTYTRNYTNVPLDFVSELRQVVNSQVTVTGWGSFTLSPVLRKVTVPVISNSYPMQQLLRQHCRNKVIMGEPLIFRQSNSRWKQIGIVSFVSSQGCQTGYPYGYKRLGSYLTWVQNVMSSYSGSSSTTTTPSPSSSSQTSTLLSLVISLCFVMQL